MDDCKANYVVIRSLLGSCLSDINNNMSLWHYGILLPEEEEDCSLAYLLNLTFDEFRNILELCGLIIVNNNNIVKVINSTSGYGGNYSWPMFLLENSLTKNYFSQMNLSIDNNTYSKKMFYIGLGVESEIITNPSTQFNYKKPRKIS